MTTFDTGTMLRTMSETPWAILPQVLERMVHAAMAGVVEVHAAAAQRPASRSGAIAVLPLYGVIRQKGPTFTDLLFDGGGTSTEVFAQVFRQMVADPEIKAIVIDVDSPGGTVFGVPELAAEVLRARGTKPIVAVVNSLAASAAYWVASAADEIVMTPSGEAGSIGVWAMHIDFSKWDEMHGLSMTYISAGKYKVEGNEDEPLSEEARAFLQTQVDEYYDAFVNGVAKGRGVPVSTVRSGYGEGRTFTAKPALAAGIVDRIGTLQDVLKRLGGSTASTSGGERMGIRQAMGEIGESAASIIETGVEAGAIPSHTSPSIADPDTPWDGPGEVAACPAEEAPLRKLHTWVDSNGDPDVKSSYKLPHHRASDFALVPRGLHACAQRLSQTDLPAGDVAGVKAHLARHYRELEETPPWESKGLAEEMRRRLALAAR